MTGILAPDWQEQVTAEQRARSAALMSAALGSGWDVVDRAADRCYQLDEVRRYALLLDEALERAGWMETRACYGRLDEGETRTEA